MLKRKTKEQRFWQWFIDNSDRIFNFEADQEVIFDELESQMHKVNKYLTFEFSSVKDGKREFIVSADGIREAFPAVRDLAAAAPPLERWNIIPFRPPKDIGFTIQIEDYSLGPEDIWFSHEIDSDRLGLILYIRDLSEANEQVAAQAVYILLDSALGEYDVEERIGFLEREPLPSNPENFDLLPFASIKQVFDDLSHSVMNPESEPES
jgi:hypothetical protein